VIALNYGSRAEIAAAANARGKACAGEIEPARSTSKHRRRAADPRPSRARPADPHVGRGAAVQFPAVAGGLCRALFLDTLWPDFDEQAFADALERFAARQRRFGGR
jgi:undecaprenyl diphosphate synthase